MEFPRRIAIAIFTAALLLGACQRSETPPAPDRTALDAAAQRIARPAWLRERLPEHAVAYLRVPSFWGLVSAPNGRPLDAAFANARHAEIVASLRAAVGKDPLIAKSGIGPAAALLLGDLAAPVEMTAIDAGGVLNPASTLLLTVELDVADVAALNAKLTAPFGSKPLLSAPLDANGKGALAQGGFLRFDAAKHRLFVLYGVAASAPTLDSLISQIDSKRAHPMHAVEREIDVSGQGLFAWMSLKGVAGMASAQIPQSKPGTLLRDFFDKSQSLAFGWGTVGGRGRLQMRVDAPNARLLSYLAAEKLPADLAAVGAPRWAATFSLPTPAKLAAFTAALDADFGIGSSTSYAAAMTKMKEEIGFDLADVVRLAGPQLIAFEDTTGPFFAVRAADRKALYAEIERIGARFGWRRETARSGAAEVHHLAIPGFKPKAGEPEPNAWLALYSRIGTHFYWIEEGDWLVFADVPQALADRAASQPDTSLGDWFTQHQSYDVDHALMGVTGVTRNAQRTVYYAYLNLLQALGDGLAQPVNLMDLPSAGALHLPVEGAAGISIDAMPDYLGIGLTYEQTPAEMLLADGGTVTTVATIAILAAIAVPAYEEYTLRAEVANALAGVAAVKTAIAQYDATTGGLPADEDDLDVPELDPDSAKYLENYYVDGGAIVLVFGDEADAKLADKVLVLKPYRGRGGELRWQCGDLTNEDSSDPLADPDIATDLPSKWLPSSCR